MNLWLLCGMTFSTALLAQQATNSPGTGAIETPAPAPAATTPAGPGSEAPPAVSAAAPTNAPAAKTPKKQTARNESGKKKSGKKTPNKTATHRAAVASSAELRTVPLVAGPAVVAANHVNVRAQAKLHSEVIGHLSKGEAVTVIEEVVQNKSAPDEPSAWAKITLPPGAHVWVKSAYIDPAAKNVKATRLNLRAGPGENYSVLGRLVSGETVKELTTKGDWTEIEPPASAFAFVAAQFLKQGEAAPAATTVAAAPTAPATTAPTAPAPETAAAAPVQAPPATAPAPTAPPAVETPVPAPTPPAATAPETTAPTTAAAATPPTAAPETTPQEPLPPRVVLREGVVRGMTSIQAPSDFALISPDNGKTMDYLYTTSKELDLRRYKGLRIIVTGQEGLDERWGHTPVLTIQKIEVLSEPPDFGEVPPASATP
ncbi:MAG: SH3 domain-containing protein [Limisphaerales bacterium]